MIPFAGVVDSKAVADDIVASDKCFSDSSSSLRLNLNEILQNKISNIRKHTSNPNV
jgi:hypothetical protein